MHFCTAINYKQTGIGEPCSNREAWQNIELTHDYIDHLKKASETKSTPTWNNVDYESFWQSNKKDRDTSESMMRKWYSLESLVFAECKFYNGTYIKLIRQWLNEWCTHPWSFPNQDFDKQYLNGQYFVDLASGNKLD